MEVITFAYKDRDDLAANTYVLKDGSNCVVIDPSVNYSGIKDFINKNGLTLKGIIITHTHFDHIRGVNVLVDAFSSPLFVPFEDEIGLKNTKYNCSCFYKEDVVVDIKPILVCDGEKIHLLTEDIIVISTPYHTKGSSCYYLKDSNIIFTGDSLFKMTVGRTDLPSSSPENKQSSLAKLMSLPDNVKVYPGHGRNTSIGDERNLNPFVNRL